MPEPQASIQQSASAQQAIQPAYTIRQDIYRSIIPKSLFVILLSAVLYILVELNFALINRYVPGNLRVFLLIIFLFAITIHALLSYKSYLDKSYVFFADRMRIMNKIQEDILFSSIKSVRKHAGFFDNIFKTGSITIEAQGKIYKIINIRNLEQNFQYIQSLQRGKTSINL